MADPIVCTGRPVDDTGQPIGDPCGRRSPHHPDGMEVEKLRAAGWRIGPERPDDTRDAMCPSCARPDPAIARGLTTKGQQ